MSGVTGLVDTLMADKLSLRADLVRLPSASVVPGPGPMVPVEPVGNDVRVLSDAARDRQFFAAASPAAGVAQAASGGQELSIAAREIGTILAGLPSPAGPATAASALVLDRLLAQPGALGRSLAAAVATSGLFYESHLAAFAAGQLDACALQLEPQAAFGSRADGQAREPRADVPGKDGPQSVPQLVAQGARGDPQALLHPQARALIAAQLDVLATGMFHWRGQAWPGAAMEWSVWEDCSKRRGEAVTGNGAPGWSTTFSLLLPRLGQVNFRLSLSASTLRAGVVASEAACASLRAGTGELQERLAAAGLELPGLAVSTSSAP